MVEWALVVGGGVSIAAGAVFWILRSDRVSTLDAECGASGAACPPSASGDIATGKTYSALSLTFLSLGVVAAGAGAGLLLFGGDSHAGPTARLVPLPAGAGVTGAF
jgi:hypothetical protein